MGSFTAAGSLRLIDSKTPSSQSTLELTSGISSGFYQYEIRLTNVIPATDGEDLQLQVSTDGGSNWKTTGNNYKYGFTAVFETSSVVVGNNSTNQIRLTRNAGSASGETGVSGVVLMVAPANGDTEPLFKLDLTHVDNSARPVSVDGAGLWDTTEVIDAVRFQFGSGNIESGEVDLYGVEG